MDMVRTGITVPVLMDLTAQIAKLVCIIYSTIHEPASLHYVQGECRLMAPFPTGGRGGGGEILRNYTNQNSAHHQCNEN